MADDSDIRRSANLLIQHHGSMAELFARFRVEAMQASGDLDGEAHWRRIMSAIKALRRVSNTMGEDLPDSRHEVG